MKELKTDAILTKAETRIALGYVDGKIGKEIADENCLSYNTVVRHTQNIYDKTGINRSTNALVAWFIALNFSIDLSELKRAIVPLLLLLAIGYQTARLDFDNYPLKQFRARKVEERIARPIRPRNRRRTATISTI